MVRDCKSASVCAPGVVQVAALHEHAGDLIWAATGRVIGEESRYVTSNTRDGMTSGMRMP